MHVGESQGMHAAESVYFHSSTESLHARKILPHELLLSSLLVKVGVARQRVGSIL